MYHKLKNTLTALGMTCGFLVAGALFGAPATSETAAPAERAPVSEQEFAFAMAKVALSLMAAEIEGDLTAADPEAHADATATDRPAEASAKVTTGSGLRLQLGMPYYSFGAVLPRRRES